MFLWKKLQQLFENFCIKLGAVPALDHGNKFFIFAGRREGIRIRGPIQHTHETLKTTLPILPFKLLQEYVQIHAFLRVNERNLERSWRLVDTVAQAISCLFFFKHLC